MPEDARAMEKELAEQIAAHERHVRAIVEQTPAASELTEGRTDRERTRGVAVKRLGNAVRTLQRIARDERRWRDLAGEARGGWERTQHLSWTLAMSARQVASQEARRFARTDTMRDDLKQAGFVGLLRAARRYEPSKGVRFTTYARWWVQAEVKDALNRSRIVRIPGNAEHLRQKLRAELEAQVARDEPASVARAAAAVNVDPDTANRLLALDLPQSLDQPWSDEEGRLGHDHVPDYAAPAPDEQVEQLEDIERLNEAVETLPDRDAYVVCQRHGVGPGVEDRRTLADLGDELGVSAQRVRQIQKRAERSLRDALQAATDPS